MLRGGGGFGGTKQQKVAGADQYMAVEGGRRARRGAGDGMYRGSNRKRQRKRYIK